MASQISRSNPNTGNTVQTTAQVLSYTTMHMFVEDIHRVTPAHAAAESRCCWWRTASALPYY